MRTNKPEIDSQGISNEQHFYCWERKLRINGKCDEIWILTSSVRSAITLPV